MQRDHTQGETPPPPYTKAPNFQLSNTTESSHFPSLYISDPPLCDRILPPLPFRGRVSKSLNTENSDWPLANSLDTFRQSGKSQPSTNTTNSPNDSPSLIQVGSPGSRSLNAGSALLVDDADVRLAAEALEDLRAGSPPQKSRVLPKSPRPIHEKRSQQREPLLSLLTTSHPLIGNAIGGSLSAYSASKRYSPRFKSSAEYVERRFTPVVNTVGSVGRMTGVEGGMRWILGGRSIDQPLPHADQCAETSNKRRKLEEDIETDNDFVSENEPGRRRQPSLSSTPDSLPAYDELRSPRYELQQAIVPSKSDQDPSSSRFSWQSRLALSTSGLSIAMSEESLRSLKYCLSWLRWANEHIGKIVMALKAALEQYEYTFGSESSKKNDASEIFAQNEAERHALGEKIAILKKDVLKTLKQVVDIVSKYAGGALPENTRILVRRHLTSLPQRFRLASSRPSESSRKPDDADGKLIEGGRRILVLAKEGLDMMTQVSGVLDGTIVSAEEWCKRLGRSKRETSHSEHVDMSITEKSSLELSEPDLTETSPDFSTS